MPADLLKFVDQIGTSPTTRLDINDQASTATSWHTDIEWTPGRLERAMSENAMSDGGVVSSSRKGFGTLRCTTRLRAANSDTLATQFQLLTRELDRADNWIQFQQTGATKPVFFKTYRSDIAEIRVVKVQAGMLELSYEILTDPHMLGNMETISIGTVNNDPAHATNGCYFDVTGVIGDVPAPCLIVDTVASTSSGIYGVRQHGTPSDGVFFYQAESATLMGGVNPGGGPDVAMSGTGTNNFRRSNAADHGCVWDITGTDAQRLARAGAYRLLAVTRTTSTNWKGSAYYHKEFDRDGVDTRTANDVQVAAGRTVTDLGIVDLGETFRAGQVGSSTPPQSVTIGVEFTRASGADTMDFDYIQLVPCDETSAWWQIGRDADTTSYDQAFDSANEAIYRIETAGTLPTGTTNKGTNGNLSGGFINLVPNQTNRVIWVRFGDLDTGDRTIVKADTSSLTVYYWPRYTFIRPSAT
jgi:hypothetical protein